MRILLADDDAVLRRLVQMNLEAWGYQVTAAADGAEAWEAFCADPYSILITDWSMPKMDGLELIRRVRAREQPDLPYVFILVLTGRSAREDLLEGMEAGADEFMPKPFDRDELRVRLRSGERILRLERTLAEQNRELRAAREELEERVRERTAELARTNKALRAEVEERKRALRELEAAQRRLIEEEEEQKRFQREVIRAVTGDRLHLLDAVEPPPAECRVLDLPVPELALYSGALKEVQRAAEDAGMARGDIDDLVLAVGEALSNALKHASDCHCGVYRDADRIVVRVSDRGHGIRPEHLPASLLRRGFSTKVSLGMGYTLMLKLADRVCLATGAEGTVVQMEKALHPDERVDADVVAMLERF